ncbi:MAG: DUF2017 family protein [Actinobacteria bacterium]|uniref:Unannotated protein n=1 Tax=freshwater metagenome TaxID=449393 RepID=A0A6J7JW70_9ZZZZ|nr:DUF2017 family protein [Actinomycetota bacterium]MSZ02164.1 DUF2017 family protein [Actinomycetota bacterium]
MSNFEKVGDGYSLDLTLDEAQILINLVEQLLELLGEGDFFHHYDSSDPLAQLLAMPAEIVTPDDPVLLRLLPNAYADPEAASDFRRYTEPQLRGAKQKNLRLVREQLTVLVDENLGGVIEDLDADIWLKAINDLRIALSIRLEISETSFETFELLPDEDPQKPVYAVYFWLGWLQENLLELVL